MKLSLIISSCNVIRRGAIYICTKFHRITCAKLKDNLSAASKGFRKRRHVYTAALTAKAAKVFPLTLKTLN